MYGDIKKKKQKKQRKQFIYYVFVIDNFIDTKELY